MDGIRTEMGIQLVCSECGEKLECNLEKSKFHAGHAGAANAIFAIRPCQRCIDNLKRPLRDIKNALANIGAVE